MVVGAIFFTAPLFRAGKEKQIITPLGRRPWGLHRRLIGVCVCVSLWSLRGGGGGGAEQMSACGVAVCFLAKISLHRPTCKTTFATLDTVTGNLAVISRFHHFQINERYDFFSFFETLFLHKTTVSFTMVIKRSPGEEFAGGGR